MAVSRAGYKLESAVRAFHFDFHNKVVLDIGSSTGGFTEFALNSGARKVIAIEKGTDQMKAPLRFNLQVVLFEKTDIFDVGLKNGKVLLRETPGVIVADVSFVSLREVLMHVKKNLADEKTEFLVMLKPQFEASERQLVRGVVKNERMRRDIIRNFEIWLREHGFFIANKHDNEIAGKNGNVERFYYLKIAKKNK